MLGWVALGGTSVLVGLILGISLATGVDFAAPGPWWDVLSAVGTLLAVACALSVPKMQLWLTERQEGRKQLPGLWVAHKTASDAIAAIERAAEKLANGGTSSSFYLTALRERLNMSGVHAREVLGLVLYGRIYTALSGLIANALLLENGDLRKESAARLVSTARALSNECVHLRTIEGLWLIEVSERFKKLGEKVPEIPGPDKN